MDDKFRVGSVYGEGKTYFMCVEIFEQTNKISFRRCLKTGQPYGRRLVTNIRNLCGHEIANCKGYYLSSLGATR